MWPLHVFLFVLSRIIYVERALLSKFVLFNLWADLLLICHLNPFKNSLNCSPNWINLNLLLSSGAVYIFIFEIWMNWISVCGWVFVCVRDGKTKAVLALYRLISHCFYSCSHSYITLTSHYWSNFFFWQSLIYYVPQFWSFKRTSEKTAFNAIGILISLTLHKCPWAKHWTPNFLLKSVQHLAWCARERENGKHWKVCCPKKRFNCAI